MSGILQNTTNSESVRITSKNRKPSTIGTVKTRMLGAMIVKVLGVVPLSLILYVYVTFMLAHTLESVPNT